MPSPKSLANFRGGTNVLSLSAGLPAGKLTVEAREFSQLGDRTVVTSGTVGRNEIYRAVFSHNNDSSVHAVLRDKGITTQISLQDHPMKKGVGIVTIVNDNQVPQQLLIDTDVLLETKDPQLALIEPVGHKIDLVGNRQVPNITAKQIADLYADTPAFKEFMRGAEHHEKAAAKKKGGVNWKCAWICLVPACGLTCLFWVINKKETAKTT